MVLLVAILAPPGQYGRDLAAEEGGAFRWGKGAGEAGKRLALGVLDPPAVAVAEKMDEVTRARSASASALVNPSPRNSDTACRTIPSKSRGPS